MLTKSMPSSDHWDGTWYEGRPDGGEPRNTQDRLEALPTEDSEVVMSSQRRRFDDEVPDDLLIDFDPSNAGGGGEDTVHEKDTDDVAHDGFAVSEGHIPAGSLSAVLPADMDQDKQRT